MFDCGSDLQERVLILPSHHLCALLYARHRLLGDHSHLINPNPRIKLSVRVYVLLSPKDPVLWCQPMLEMVKSSRPKQPKAGPKGHQLDVGVLLVPSSSILSGSISPCCMIVIISNTFAIIIICSRMHVLHYHCFIVNSIPKHIPVTKPY